MTIILWILLFVKTATTCSTTLNDDEWQDPGNNDGDNGAVDPFFQGNLTDPKKWYAHWPDADGVINGVKYYDWMKEYKNKRKQEEDDYLEANGGKKKKYPADADTDWPAHWKGLGAGIGGVAPPPYAMVMESSGKPDLCYLPPQLGKCSSFTLRWGFNPFRNDCAEFIYSGCEGNRNNFYTKKRCLAVCMNPPQSTCIHNPEAKLTNFESWIRHLPHGEF